jgi:hypothetical protein
VMLSGPVCCCDRPGFFVAALADCFKHNGPRLRRGGNARKCRHGLACFHRIARFPPEALKTAKQPGGLPGKLIGHDGIHHG